MAPALDRAVALGQCAKFAQIDLRAFLHQVRWMTQGVTIERRNGTATIHVRGDLVLVVVRPMYDKLRATIRRRDVRHVILDFTETKRVDSAAAATVALCTRLAVSLGKQLTLANVAAHHRATLDLVPPPVAVTPLERSGNLETIGERILDVCTNIRAIGTLVVDIGRQLVGLVSRRTRLPANAVAEQIVKMGVNGLFIVALLMFLLGVTMGFQGGVQMQRFGAGPYIADLIGLSLVRELAPMMAAVIIAGRTGAAIAAELGTMRVRSEIDALSAMGINPTRYLVLPRLVALTLVQPALTLIAMFIGIGGGMMVAALAFDLAPATFWHRIVERVAIGDFAFGIVKSVVFAWTIGLAGCHFGIRAQADAGSVGIATTRTVVTSIFFIVVIDAIFATIVTIGKYG